MRARISSSLARAVAIYATRGAPTQRDSACLLLPLRAPPIRKVSIARGVHASKLQVSATASMNWKEGGSKREEKLKPETVLYSPSAFHRSGAHSLRDRYPDLQVIAVRSLPIPRGTVASIAKGSLLTVAGPCGIYTRFPCYLLMISAKISKQANRITMPKASKRLRHLGETQSYLFSLFCADPTAIAKDFDGWTALAQRERAATTIPLTARKALVSVGRCSPSASVERCR
jgi:hypothetical protein